MKIKNISSKILSNVWKPLKMFQYDYISSKGVQYIQQREVYDKGDGACVLMYHPEQQTVLLTKQFRMPTYINGNLDGIMLEVPAGMLDGDEPLHCIQKEIEEETGYAIPTIRYLGFCFMTPGAVTEKTYFYFAHYTEKLKVSSGGGCANEQEDIVLVTYSKEQIKQMVLDFEIIDAKTMLVLQYALLHNLLE